MKVVNFVNQVVHKTLHGTLEKVAILAVPAQKATKVVLLPRGVVFMGSGASVWANGASPKRLLVCRPQTWDPALPVGLREGGLTFWLWTGRDDSVVGHELVVGLCCDIVLGLWALRTPGRRLPVPVEPEPEP
jgi:hypothetical protein